MRTACIFPGQGSQRPGMGEELFQEFPELVKQADEVLGYSIVELCLKDEGQLLNDTQYTQPALFVVNALSYLDYMRYNPIPDYLAGHSLGEYNALVASGMLTFQEGLKLVALRGRLMSEISGGAMAAVVGLTGKELGQILEEHYPAVSIANYNSHLQNVISGPADIIDKCEQFFTDKKIKFLKLNVSGAFHSHYMWPAQDGFDDALSRACFKAPQITVLSDYTARPFDLGNVRENLSMQLVSPVKWLEITEALLADTDEIIQIGPGRVLDGLTRRIIKGQ